MLINRVIRGTIQTAAISVLIAWPVQAETFAASRTAKLDVPEVLNANAIDVEFEEDKVAASGERTRFHLSFTNEGAEPARNIVLLMPVPQDVDVLNGTATETRAEVSYSIDGGLTFVTPDRLLGRSISQEEEVRLSNVTTVRWELTRPVAPGASGALSYEGVFQ